MIQLLIGREDATNNLLCHDGAKPLRIVKDNSVPDSVSRLHTKGQRSAHCRLTIDPEANSVKIENYNPANVTIVDGAPITAATYLHANSVVELGGHRFRLNLAPLYKHFGVKPAVKPIDPPAATAYSTAHLRRLWEEFDTEVAKTMQRQQRITAIRSISGIASPLAMCMGLASGHIPILPSFSVPAYMRIILTAFGVAGILWAVALSLRKSNNLAMGKRRLENKYKPLYVCPNKDCTHKFPLTDYETSIRNLQACPSCKCKYFHGQ